jgi:uncharacterized protein YbaR (Trm112 family)
MVDKELLELIVCPETHQALGVASPELLERLNARIEKHEVKNKAGTALLVALVEGLVRSDGRVLYPVVDGIPMLLIDEGIELA